MKNWVIEKLGGVSKKDHEEVIQTANSLKNMADDYSQRISDGLKEKAERGIGITETQQIQARPKMMTMFLIGLGAIAVLIGITILVDMPPIDEFGQREKE